MTRLIRPPRPAAGQTGRRATLPVALQGLALLALCGLPLLQQGCASPDDEGPHERFGARHHGMGGDMGDGGAGGGMGPGLGGGPAIRGGGAMPIGSLPRPGPARVAMRPEDRASYKRPDMAARPQELVPPVPPKGVRYRYATAEAVVAARDDLQHALEGKAPLPAKKLFVFAGAWTHLWKAFNGHDELRVRQPGQVGDDGVAREGPVIDSADTIEFCRKQLADLLQADGGYTIRALTAPEMELYAPFAPAGLAEPIFVVASRGGKYRWIVQESLHGDQSMVLDELNALQL